MPWTIEDHRAETRIMSIANENNPVWHLNAIQDHCCRSPTVTTAVKPRIVRLVHLFLSHCRRPHQGTRTRDSEERNEELQTDPEKDPISANFECVPVVFLFFDVAGPIALRELYAQGEEVKKRANPRLCC